MTQTLAPAPAETIVAIATPPGRGGVGIVRVSGADPTSLITGVIGRTLEPRLATVVAFCDAHGEPIDQGLALYFPAPASYTGETVVEFHGHGSPAALRQLLTRCVELGARLAAPGEFTKRAFLNGKLDLAQAEAVADLIDATTATAARAAARSLSGAFSRGARAIVAGLVELRIYTEATLDFPEEEIEFLAAGDVRGRLQALRAQVDALNARATSGAVLREGLTVVMVGRPNVGKSSLLNTLAREEAAIVTPIAGTTRDAVERTIEIAGIPLTIIDTAGLRDTTDAVERIGIARTWEAVARADLVLLLVDARDSADALHPEDRAILARLPAQLPRVVIHNKTDLAQRAPQAQTVTESGRPTPHVWLTAPQGEGVDLLEAEVLRLVGVESAVEDTFLARERHLVGLRSAQQHLANAAEHLAVKPPTVELFAEELRLAQNALSALTGEFSADDLLGEIFGRFCIGK